MPDLFGEGTDDIRRLSISEEYSKRYSKWRRQEEISKLKSKYGDPSSSSSEDEYVDDFDSETEKEFLDAYSLLKKKDPRIYDPDFVAFKREIEPKVGEKCAVKRFGVREAELLYAVAGEETIPVVSEYEQRLVDAKEAFRKHSDAIDTEEFLKVKEGGCEQKEEMDRAVVVMDDDDDRQEQHFYSAHSTDNEEDEDDALIFERKYNFRFEEPDREYVKQYPRTIPSSVRESDERRRERRLRRKERKEKEIERYRQDLKRLKAHERKKVQERIEKLKAITGGLEDVLAMDEFKAEEFDQRMNDVFDDGEKIESVRSKRKKRKERKRAQKKPDDDDDFVDLVAGIPCRFKYRNVLANDFGLSAEEILMADDKELNKWASLKKCVQLRSDHVELNDKKTFDLKRNNSKMKKRILKSVYDDHVSGGEERDEEKSTISKLNLDKCGLPNDDRLKTFGINPKKFKRTFIYAKRKTN